MRLAVATDVPRLPDWAMRSPIATSAHPALVLIPPGLGGLGGLAGLGLAVAALIDAALRAAALSSALR